VNGSGIREALRLVLDFEFDRPDILLVEEPEIHLHPALEVAMMHYLREASRDAQIFLTTHSTNFLDTGDMQNVYLVSRPGGSTTVELLAVSDLETEIPRELGIRLSSLFMFDQLVFVEGPSDELIIREFAATLGINLGQANVGFVVMGSARNFTHFAAASTINFLAKRRVNLLFLIDRDERTEQQISSLRDRLGEKARLHVLARREIENYLLDSVAISSTIEMRLAAAGRASIPAPTEAEIRDAIAECADRLRNFSLMKRITSAVCGPIFIERPNLGESFDSAQLGLSLKDEISRTFEEITSLRDSLVDRIEEESQKIDASWATRKFEIVPGADLLDEVFKGYGLRYRKEKDGAEIATRMTSSQIAPEIRAILDGIERQANKSDRV